MDDFQNRIMTASQTGNHTEVLEIYKEAIMAEETNTYINTETVKAAFALHKYKKGLRIIKMAIELEQADIGLLMHGITMSHFALNNAPNTTFYHKIKKKLNEGIIVRIAKIATRIKDDEALVALILDTAIDYTDSHGQKLIISRIKNRYIRRQETR